MRWTLVATLAATMAGAGVSAPAARACDDADLFGFRAAEVRACGTVRTRGVEFDRPRTVEIVRPAVVLWRPARWELRTERVVIRDGRWDERVEPATFGLRFDFGRRRFVSVELRPATVVRTWVPAVVEVRTVRVLVPGRWETARI